MNRLKQMIMATVALAFVLTPVFAVGGFVYAAPPSISDEIKKGSCLEWDANLNECIKQTSGSGAKANSLVATVINIFSWVVGLLSVLMIIVGGFKYVTSGGDAGKVTSAKNTIMYSIIGLIVAVLAQVIVQFVLEKVAPTPAPAPASIIRSITLFK